MDSLHDQVSQLTLKVDALHQMLEQFSDQTTDMLLTLKQSGSERTSNSQPDTSAGRQTYHAYQSRNMIDSDMDHKDILSDFSFTDLDTQGGDRGLTPEVQIQRLTAQLTAAYNRIAALEEQLIARRIP